MSILLPFPSFCLSLQGRILKKMKHINLIYQFSSPLFKSFKRHISISDFVFLSKSTSFSGLFQAKQLTELNAVSQDCFSPFFPAAPNSTSACLGEPLCGKEANRLGSHTSSQDLTFLWDLLKRTSDTTRNIFLPLVVKDEA